MIAAPPKTSPSSSPNPANFVVSRLAGSLIVSGPDKSFVVGQPKQPCCWSEYGILPLVDLDHWNKPFVAELALERVYTPSGSSCVIASVGGEVDFHRNPHLLAELLAHRLLIERNGSVSERLWNLIGQFETDCSPPVNSPVSIDWLVTMPTEIWEIVRDTVLRCA